MKLLGYLCYLWFSNLAASVPSKHSYGCSKDLLRKVDQDLWVCRIKHCTDGSFQHSWMSNHTETPFHSRKAAPEESFDKPGITLGIYTRRQKKRPPQALAGPLKPLKCSQKAEIFCASGHWIDIQLGKRVKSVGWIVWTGRHLEREREREIYYIKTISYYNYYSGWWDGKYA